MEHIKSNPKSQTNIHSLPNHLQVNKSYHEQNDTTHYSPINNLVMMKFILLVAFFGLVAGQAARPRTTDPKDVQIVRSEVENNGDGTYSFRYELTDGTIVEEKGSVKPAPAGSEFPTIQVAVGSYQYVAENGQLIKLTYTADENGFQPQGEHLPTPPPIPEEIRKVLEIVYRNAAQQASAPRQQ